MSATFNISKFRANLDAKGGVAKSNRYWVAISAPSLSGNKEFLSFQCINAQLPGRNFRTTEQMIHGVSRKFPYATQYDDLTLTFICSNKMDERTTFETWQRSVINPANNIVNYYNKYIGDIIITTLNDEGNVSYTCFLEEVYPITIEAQDLSYEDSDSYLRLTVRFAYRQWTSYEDQSIAASFNIGNYSLPTIPEVARDAINVFDSVSQSYKQLLVPTNLSTAKDLFSSITSLLPVSKFSFDVGSIPFLGNFLRGYEAGKSIIRTF